MDAVLSVTMSDLNIVVMINCYRLVKATRCGTFSAFWVSY